MNGTDHNKILGILHLVYGILNAVMLAVLAVFMVFVIAIMGAAADDPLPVAFVSLVMLLVFAVSAVFALPSFVAAYAMFKRKKWAKGASIVAAVTDGMSFPFGTALCVYTLWFIFSDQGRMLYDNLQPAHALPPPPWSADATQSRKVEYIPPVSPPDWR